MVGHWYDAELTRGTANDGDVTCFNVIVECLSRLEMIGRGVTRYGCDFATYLDQHVENLSDEQISIEWGQLAQGDVHYETNDYLRGRSRQYVTGYFRDDYDESLGVPIALRRTVRARVGRKVLPVTVLEARFALLDD